MVIPVGFEPNVASVKGKCPKPVRRRDDVDQIDCASMDKSTLALTQRKERR